jgi:hypothetical protein
MVDELLQFTKKEPMKYLPARRKERLKSANRRLYHDRLDLGAEYSTPQKRWVWLWKIHPKAGWNRICKMWHGGVTIASILALAALAVAADRIGPPEIYPNPTTQPGLSNPDITQANIGDTICSKTWTTKSIRPPSSYTTKLKKRQMVEYGDTVRDPKKACMVHSNNPACYEEDHIYSLTASGHPTDPRNLWPMPYYFYIGKTLVAAKQKDEVEAFVHDSECMDIPSSRRESKHKPVKAITLERGKQILTKDWYACWVSLQMGKDCEP